jgi:glycosyltransferase involved in cell wall biosynthesis
MSAKLFPKISVITPSFNQAQFLEETITSVLSQNYPNLEYIVVDGKSTDGSHEIIQKYQDRLIWIKDKDNNQTDGINIGFRAATGEVLAYLNSDDLYLPNTLELVANAFIKNAGLLWLTGDCIIINEEGKEINKFIRSYKTALSLFNNRNTLGIADFISQPSTFIKKGLFEKVGLFNEGLEYAMDLDYWVRCYSKAKPLIIGAAVPLSKFRIHSKSKGGGYFKRQFQEVERVLEMNNATRLIRALNRLHNKLIVVLYSNYYKKAYR